MNLSEIKTHSKSGKTFVLSESVILKQIDEQFDTPINAGTER